eukprot:TRINITY_DN102578_c0_g1_i1.p1 TRINITY_DN102578_c0_g1~~TRINITY_DN102578_c0_g1_i1.p1  ORF type:complete len:509 (+),score=102.59 TRINITY_DN102578_c0_g1_i1:153-1679(+)
MDSVETMRIVEEEWNAAMPVLQDFVRIPNLTPLRDADWETNGLLDKATDHVANWVKAQNLDRCTVEIFKDEGNSPFLFIEVGGTPGSPKAASTILMYGHLDKQPHGEGWDEDAGPTAAVIKDGKLFGRGAGDDGYAVFSCIIALKALQRQGVAHPRTVILAECSEESGSMHLSHYVQKLDGRIGTPSAVYCLDAGVEDYNRFWLNTSLRGALAATLEVSISSIAQHSGTAGGIVPDVHRIMRQLLARIEDVNTGRMLLPDFFTKIPVERQAEMKAASEALGYPQTSRKIPFLPGCHPVVDDAFQLYRANSWEPSMAVIGSEGIPGFASASPILATSHKIMLAVRLPPMVDPEIAAAAMKSVLERDPPCGAKVCVDFKFKVKGFHAGEVKPNLEKAMNQASEQIFGKPPGSFGCGGTIPLMNILQEMFPDASLIVSGILGPGSNEHGPNESMPIEYAKKFTACVSMIMGLLEPDPMAWPDDVPRPAASAKKRFCFTNPKITVGQCACCF